MVIEEKAGLLTAEEIATYVERSDAYEHYLKPEDQLWSTVAEWARQIATLAAQAAEIDYLRRQLNLNENYRDPEFYGITPDPEKPKHLKIRDG